MFYELEAKENELKAESICNCDEEKVDVAPEKEKLLSLLDLARDGDQLAFGSLLDMYTPLIRSTVAKFKSEIMSNEDEEDLRQEAVLAFYSAIVSYDPKFSEVEFGLYAKVCICNRLVSQMRIMKRQRGYNTVSLDADEILESLAEYDDPAAAIIEMENERSLMQLIDSHLSEYEQSVFRMYVSGMTAAQMADRLKVDERSVSNAVYRIRSKLKKILKK